MSTQLEIKTTLGAVSVITVRGKIDGNTFHGLVERTLQVVAKGYAKLVLDFQGVSYLSSAGLVALQSILSKVKSRGGRLAIAGLAPDVARVLEMTGPTDWLNVYPDVASARASFG